MRKLSVCLSFALLLVASSARADTFTLASISVSLNTDPLNGLAVSASNFIATPFNFTLEEGQNTTATLFVITSSELGLDGDDFIPRPMSIALEFTAPPPPFGANPNGVTDAYTSVVLGESGRVGGFNVGGPTTVQYGYDGLLSISILPGEFQLGGGSAPVRARFTLVHADTGGPIGVPEPSSAMLLLLGASGVAAIGRRQVKRQAA